MNYKKFSKIWDKYIPRNIKFIAAPNTIKALIEYSKGNKIEIEKVRKFLMG